MVPRATYGTLRASTSFAIFPLHLSQFSFLLLCLLSLPLPIPSLSHLIPSSSYNDHAFFVPTSRSQNLLPNFAAPCSFSSLLFSYSIRFLISFALSLISHTPLFLSLFVLRPTFSPKHPSPLFHFSPFYRHTSFTLNISPYFFHFLRSSFYCPFSLLHFSFVFLCLSSSPSTSPSPPSPLFLPHFLRSSHILSIIHFHVNNTSRPRLMHRREHKWGVEGGGGHSTRHSYKEWGKQYRSCID